MQSTHRDSTDLLRAAGALLLAAGAAVLFIRKGVHHAWGDFAMLLLVAVPAGLLFRLAMPGKEIEKADPSRAVMVIAAIALSLPTFAELLHLLGANTGSPMATAAILLLTSIVAAYGAGHGRVPYAALLAALTALIVWMVVWGQIIEHPDASSFRGVLVFGALPLLFLAYSLARQPDSFGAREIATAGGLALVAAGTLGIFVGAAAAFTNALLPILHGPHKPIDGTAGHTSGGQSLGWDLYLVTVSVGLIWLGARVRSRGIAYTGAFGVFLFILSVGYQVARLDSGMPASGSLAGWPIVLLLLGAVGLVAAALRQGRA